MSSATRILFLYTEMAGYFLACVRALAARNVEVAVVHWPVNPEAPFDFSGMEGAAFHDRQQLTDEQLHALVEAFNPSVIVCSGWLDKGYVAVCRKWFGRVPTVLTSDNHWTGKPKQQLARLMSTFTIRRIYSHAWVPGAPQQQYVQKLGYSKSRVQTGFYSADYPLFAAQHKARVQAQNGQVPKRFLFVGRYLDFKGIFELWSAFTRLRSEGCDWELWCFGTGALWEQRAKADGIVHHGFVQPAELPGYLLQTGVFVLPSHKEPWGVVVHEMAAAGFPMLCSNAVGASTKFLDEGRNGYTFAAQSEEALYQAMKKMAAHTNEELLLMGAHSNKLAAQITPETWADALLTFVPS